jgi:hypothetical protein
MNLYSFKRISEESGNYTDFQVFAESLVEARGFVTAEYGPMYCWTGDSEEVSLREMLSIRRSPSVVRFGFKV